MNEENTALDFGTQLLRSAGDHRLTFEVMA